MKIKIDPIKLPLESIETYNNNLNNCKTNDDFADKLVVAVMTLCGSLGSPINILEIYNYYIEEGYENFELIYKPKSVETKSTENIKKKKKAFYNCLNVVYYYTDENGIKNKISSKVFPNGSIQLPGCRTIYAVHKVPQILYNFIKDISLKCKIKNDIQIIKNENEFVLKELRIVMINSNFSFHENIFQEKIKNLINDNKYDINNKENVWRIATWQPEKYAGMITRYLTKDFRHNNNNIKLEKKFNGQVSIFIFRSGKGTITGAKNTNDLLEAYNAIVKLVRDNNKELFNIEEN